MRWEPLLIIVIITGLGSLLSLLFSGKRRWLALLIWLYLGSLTAILFTPISVTGTALYIMPLGTGRVNLTNFDFSSLGFFENIILTLPFGLMLKRMQPKLSFFSTGIAGLMLGGGIEITQYVLSHRFLINRSSDINDVLANMLGVVIGGLIFAIGWRIRMIHQKRAKHMMV